jgi:hypothetical protein
MRRHRNPRGGTSGHEPGFRFRTVSRYYFHVVGQDLPIEDDQGTPFAEPSDALAHAEIIANDLAQDDDQYRGHAIVVVDEQENVVARVPIVRRTN